MKALNFAALNTLLVDLWLNERRGGEMIRIYQKVFAICIVSLFLFWRAMPGTCAGQEYIFEEQSMTDPQKLMVEQLKNYGISDKRVLEAMGKVPRHRFLPAGFFSEAAYGDHPLPIGHEQTISQPYIVAYMTERINLKPGEKVLEIGTGSGYQAAVLAALDGDVYSIEIVPELASHAIEVLKTTGYKCNVKCGDGYQGWPEFAPFSVIIVTCAPQEIPEKLVEQLAEDGRMILPLGGGFSQRLVILRKKQGKIEQEEDLPVRFVPMIKK